MIKHCIPFLLVLFALSSCNYNYYQGTQLEGQGRFEEATIEYHRAHVANANDSLYKKAYQRTAKKTVADLLKRYFRYIKEKDLPSAYQRLQKAHTLAPKNEQIKKEQKKWVRILLAGKLSLKFKSIRRGLQIADEMSLAVRVNTPNPDRILLGVVNNQTGVFSVEDVLYSPTQDILMFYSINSIGVKLVKQKSAVQKFKVQEFRSFVNFRTPILAKISGKLDETGDVLKKTQQYYPFELLKKSNSKKAWLPSRKIRYSLKLANRQIQVLSSVKRIDFIPQILYLNQKDRRIFFDFGHIKIIQKQVDGPWFFQRITTKERNYYQELEKNIILNPYFYYRDGAYPFIRSDLLNS
ncbi:MAG: hypothetical protein ACI86H_000297 [bacterium]|jgi:hypothetical protein